MYVDDLTLAAQTKHNQHRVLHIALVHSIDMVRCPLDGGNRPSCKEPVSVKKLMQGDAAWSTCKTILGWDLNTVAGTLCLLTPSWMPIPLLSLTRSHLGMAPGPRRAPLDGACAAGNTGAVSLPSKTLSKKVIVLKHISIAASLITSPIFGLCGFPPGPSHTVPQAQRVWCPITHAACTNAWQRGMGGVWFLPGDAAPIVWRSPFPPLAMQRALVTRPPPHRNPFNLRPGACGSRGAQTQTGTSYCCHQTPRLACWGQLCLPCVGNKRICHG